MKKKIAASSSRARPIASVPALPKTLVAVGRLRSVEYETDTHRNKTIFGGNGPRLEMICKGEASARNPLQRGQ